MFKYAMVSVTSDVSKPKIRSLDKLKDICLCFTHKMEYFVGKKMPEFIWVIKIFQIVN